jgi:hypothetical protein
MNEALRSIMWLLAAAYSLSGMYWFYFPLTGTMGDADAR